MTNEEYKNQVPAIRARLDTLAAQADGLPDRISTELQQANNLADKIEDLVVAKGQVPSGDRNSMLIAYWSLVFELHRGIIALVAHRFYGAAWSLARSIFEATIGAHIALSCDEEVLRRLQDDTYRTSFGTVGAAIDKEFALDGFFQNFLQQFKEALHSYTHAGLLQLSRRFKGTDVVPNYSEAQMIGLIRSSTSCVFMVNNLVTKHLGYEKEWQKNTDMYVEWRILKEPHANRA